MTISKSDKMAIVNTFLVLVFLSVITGQVLSAVSDSGSSNSLQMVQASDRVGLSKGQDSGHLVSCLGLKTEKFNVTWSPKILKTEETVVFYADVITSQQFTHGKLWIQIWIDDIPDPIYDDSRDQHCDQFIQIIQPYLPQLKCPIPQGFHLKQVYPLKIVPTIPLPSGNYKTKVEIWNEDNVRVICFTGDINIEDE